MACVQTLVSELLIWASTSIVSTESLGRQARKMSALLSKHLWHVPMPTALATLGKLAPEEYGKQGESLHITGYKY